MNEDEYRSIYQDVNKQRCVFEKVTLLGFAGCVYSKKLLLAEREAMACTSKEAQPICLSLLNTMRNNARFALQVTKANEPLPHSKELKVQAGGLFGLQQYLIQKDTAEIEQLNEDQFRFDNPSNNPIKNIHQTVAEAIKEFGEIKHFPYTQMVKAVLHFERPSRRNKKGS